MADHQVGEQPENEKQEEIEDASGDCRGDGSPFGRRAIIQEPPGSREGFAFHANPFRNPEDWPNGNERGTWPQAGYLEHLNKVNGNCTRKQPAEAQKQAEKSRFLGQIAIFKQEQAKQESYRGVDKRVAAHGANVAGKFSRRRQVSPCQDGTDVEEI